MMRCSSPPQRSPIRDDTIVHRKLFGFVTAGPFSLNGARANDDDEEKKFLSFSSLLISYVPFRFRLLFMVRTRLNVMVLT